MIVKGKVRSTNVYKDNVQSVEIHFSKKMSDNLPIQQNQGTEIYLIIHNKSYLAKLRHTDKNNYTWISPKCYLDGQRKRLADIILETEFKINDDIFIEFTDNQAEVIFN